MNLDQALKGDVGQSLSSPEPKRKPINLYSVRKGVYESLDDIKYPAIQHFSTHPDVRLCKVGVLEKRAREGTPQRFDHYYLFVQQGETKENIKKRIQDYLTHIFVQKAFKSSFAMKSLQDTVCELTSIETVKPKTRRYH